MVDKIFFGTLISMAMLCLYIIMFRPALEDSQLWNEGKNVPAEDITLTEHYIFCKVSYGTYQGKRVCFETISYDLLNRPCADSICIHDTDWRARDNK